jgi:DNA-binding response OmpR family regulator
VTKLELLELVTKSVLIFIFVCSFIFIILFFFRFHKKRFQASGGNRPYKAPFFRSWDKKGAFYSENAQKENLVISLDNGGLKADVTARLVYIDGERIEMSPKEYDLFFYMLANRNIAISREKFISEVWGYDFYGDVRTLDTHIKLLRKSLGRYANLIVTLRGVGYRFEG